MDLANQPNLLPARPPAARLAGLDVLRGIAAFCVLHFHAWVILGAESGLKGKAYLAVDFFFMLSGYVMARTYEHRLADGYGAMRFMAVRYRRLWPIMAIGALIGAPVLALELKDPAAFVAILLANLFLIPVVTLHVLFPVNIPAWSILAELSVNLAHGLFLRRWRTSHLAMLVAGLLPILAWIGIEYRSLDYGARVDTALVGFVRALLSYTLGVILWRCWRDRPTLRIPPLLAFAAMPALVFLSQVLRLEGWHFDLAFIVAICPLLMAGGLAYQGDHSLGRWLGAISFPLYAINMPMLFWSRDLGLNAAIGIACMLALATFISLLTALPSRRVRSVAKA